MADVSRADLVTRLAQAKTKGHVIKRHGSTFLTVEGFAYTLRVAPSTLRQYKHDQVFPAELLKPVLVIPQNHRHLYSERQVRKVYSSLYLSRNRGAGA